METAILFFGVSSPIIAEYEETSIRCGLRIAAGIQNHNDPNCGTLGYPIFRTDDFPEETRHLNFAVPLFRPSNRETAVQHANRLGFTNPATLIDPTATLPRHVSYGSGLYVNAGCIIGSRCSLGDWVLVNRGANVGHHAHIGDFVSIGPGAVLSGNTTVGDRATIGAGAIILPKVKIGAGAVVGAGCVVTQDIPAGSVVVGNPARHR